MKVVADSPDRFRLGLTPWAPWIVSAVAGVSFLGIVIVEPFYMPGWAKMVFAGLGIIAPFAFLATHAKVDADFDKASGDVTITRWRPIGGETREVIALETISAINEIEKVDSDDNTFFRIELVVGPVGSVAGHGQLKHVSLTTAPISASHREAADRLSAWLDVPLGQQSNSNV